MSSEDTDYEKLLETGWEDIPEPKVLPDGTWLLQCVKAKYQAGGDKTNANVMFIYVPKMPMDDVREDELEELEGYDWAKNQIFFKIWLQRPADWAKLRSHLSKHHIDVDSLNKADSIAAAQGTEIYGQLADGSYKNAQNENVLDNKIVAFQPYEA